VDKKGENETLSFVKKKFTWPGLLSSCKIVSRGLGQAFARNVVS
jgi:hypothetical protein